jgi:hypothetical protein
MARALGVRRGRHRDEHHQDRDERPADAYPSTLA